MYLQVEPPQKFDGNRRSFKAFWASMQVYLYAIGGQDMDDGRKIAFVLNHLLTSEPIVVSWCRNYLDSIEDKESAIHNFCKDTFQEFGKKLQENFLPNNHDQTRALYELHQLKQGDKTVENHVLAFKELVHHAGVEPKSESHWYLIEPFLESLHPVLAYKIRVKSPVGTNRIEDYYDVALKLEANHWTRGMEHLLYKSLMKQGDCFNTFRRASYTKLLQRADTNYYHLF